jgi:hypothetical protein
LIIPPPPYWVDRCRRIDCGAGLIAEDLKLIG